MLREARATLRDPFTLLILVLVPLGALLLFSSVLSTKVRGITLGVLDASESPTSRRLLADLEAPGTFHVRPYPDRAAIDRALLGGEIGVAVVLPLELERDRIRRGRSEIQVLYDRTEVVLAGNSEASIRALMTATALDQLGARASVTAVGGAAPDAASGPGGRIRQKRGDPGRGIQIVPHVLFNPRLDGVPFMVSGTFGFVMSFLTTLIVAVSIVNERSAGTFEQLQVTPATSIEILLGKILPLGGVFAVDVVLMMLLAGLLFGVWPAGSGLFFVVLSTFYQIFSLSLGVIISASSATAAEAVSKTVLLSNPLILLSGFNMPTQNMPAVFRALSEMVPATHYIRVSRAIYLRGAGPGEVLWEVAIIALMGVALVSLAGRAIGRRT
jgi:ABC-2 type transport system permease protein